MPRRAKGLSVAVAVAVVTLFSCDPYRHTNPYDPLTVLELEVVGPDTLPSVGQYAQYAARSSPAFPDTAGRWESSDSGLLAPAGQGQFVTKQLPLWPLTATVSLKVSLGQFDTTATISTPNGPLAVPAHGFRHTASRTVVLTQRLVRIRLRCPAAHACDPIAAGAEWSVWIDGFDALDNPILGLTGATTNPASGSPIATFAVRDTSIASLVPVGIRAATVTAHNTGATWIVATRTTLLDSLQLVVR